MTIEQAQKKLALDLNNIYESREALNISELVMEKITGLGKIDRLLKKEIYLTLVQTEQFNIYIKKLSDFMPVQYVLNETWFTGIKFFVNEDVLIPRPETEELVEKIFADLKSSTKQNVSVLDIGTGSGCIAISIKKKFPPAQVYALDISEQALTVAKRNATYNDVEIIFSKADILTLNQKKFANKFDVLVSNPPYVKKSEAISMSNNVLLYEPEKALFVPDEDPVIFYRHIIKFASGALNTEGKIYFEINELSGNEIEDLLYLNGFSETKILNDLNGKTRFVTSILLNHDK